MKYYIAVRDMISYVNVVHVRQQLIDNRCLFVTDSAGNKRLTCKTCKDQIYEAHDRKMHVPRANLDGPWIGFQWREV